MVGGMAAGALPPLRLAVVMHNVPECHSAVVLGVDVGGDRVVTEVRGLTAASRGTDRADFPTVVQRSKGSASGLESQLASGSSRAEALTAYEHDKHAASAHASRGSLLATWTRLLRAWLGPTVSFIPVAPERIAFVGAAMEMRGWRSFSNYIPVPRKHMLLRGIHGPHGTNWKQHKVHVLSHEAGAMPAISPAAR